MRSFNRSRLNAAINRYNQSARRFNQLVNQMRWVVVCPCGHAGYSAHMVSTCPSCGRPVEVSQG